MTPEKLKNVEGLWDEGDVVSDEEREEGEGYYDWMRDEDKEIYHLGLGDEEVKYYVGMDEDVYKEWEKELNEGSEDGAVGMTAVGASLSFSSDDLVV